MAPRKPSLNPMEYTFADTPAPSISKQDFTIAGINTTVYGLAELAPSVTEVAVIWLLHPRLESSKTMEPVAAAAITAWNARVKDGKVKHSIGSRRGVIAVSIDLRNHGARQVDSRANDVWRTGNPNHAKDMFSICQGTSFDISLLIDHLASYIFPAGRIDINQHICLGVSLGGHTTWQLLVHDPRISTCIIIIGSADFVRLLTDRARLSKLPDYVRSSPPGKDFLGSPSFPVPLVQSISRFDAAQQIMGAAYSKPEVELSEGEKERLRNFYDERLKGKRLLVVSGGADKMSPYSRSEPVIEFLKKAIDRETGWWRDGGVQLRNVVFPGVKHELTLDMVAEAVDFVVDSVVSGAETRRGPKL